MTEVTVYNHKLIIHNVVHSLMALWLTGSEMPHNLLQQRAFLLIALLLFYCSIPVSIFIAMILEIFLNPSHLIDKGKLLEVIKEISSNPGEYTNIIHQMIIPTVAAITAVDFKSISSSKFANWLFLIPMFTIFICIFSSLIFNIYSTDDDIKGVISQFFVNLAGNLAVYVMMLVGLQFSGE